MHVLCSLLSLFLFYLIVWTITLWIDWLTDMSLVSNRLYISMAAARLQLTVVQVALCCPSRYLRWSEYNLGPKANPTIVGLHIISEGGAPNRRRSEASCTEISNPRIFVSKTEPQQLCRRWVSLSAMTTSDTVTHAHVITSWYSLCLCGVCVISSASCWTLEGQRLPVKHQRPSQWQLAWFFLIFLALASANYAFCHLSIFFWYFLSNGSKQAHSVTGTLLYAAPEARTVQKWRDSPQFPTYGVCQGL